MSAKTIIAWINGSAQSIEVADTPEIAPMKTLEDRVVSLENKATMVSTVTLLSSAWSGSISPYSQTITINGITNNSKIDLQPTPDQFAQLQDDEASLVVENNGASVTVYSIGSKPSVDMILQCVITDVNINEAFVTLPSAEGGSY